MQEQTYPDPDAQVLPESMATRLLERASQLDAVRTGSIAIADLRAAATAAGISRGAFDAALDELQQPAPPAPVAAQARPPRRTRWKLMASVVVAFMAIGFVGVGRAVSRPPSEMPSEAFWLNCLSPGEAAVLLRPTLGANAQTLFVPSAPRILRVYGSPAVIEKARAELDRLQSPGSPACTMPPGAVRSR